MNKKDVIFDYKCDTLFKYAFSNEDDKECMDLLKKYLE